MKKNKGFTLIELLAVITVQYSFGRYSGGASYSIGSRLVLAP